MKSAPVLAAALLLAPLLLASAQQAQSPPATTVPTKVQHEANFDVERQQANDLYVAHKPLEALPLYEDLCRQDSTVAVFAERHAGGIFAKMATVSDPKEKQRLINEGMAELRRAQSLGDNSPYVQTLLSMGAKSPLGAAVGGPLGGSALTVGYTYRGNQAAQPLFQQAEAAFGHNDLADALKSYLAAAAADPAFYDAALYSGDVYFRLKDSANAAIWYAKAIAIDPNRETAYRYWGDSLFRAGDIAGARTRFEQAIVAEPYSQATWAGLRQWAQAAHASIVTPQVPRPAFTTQYGKLAPNPAFNTEAGDGSSSWLVYQQTRIAKGATVGNQTVLAGASMANGGFIPNGYVHTLAEEVDAFNAMLADVQKKLAAGSVMPDKLSPPIKTLLQIQKDGLLQPFVLLSYNDAGLRHGYPEYRAEHRDQLLSYIDRYLIGPPPAAPAQVASPPPPASR